MQVTGKQEREEREGGLLWSEHAWLRMVHAHAWGQDLMRRGREGCLEQACHGTVKSHAWGRGVCGRIVVSGASMETKDSESWVVQGGRDVMT